MRVEIFQYRNGVRVYKLGDKYIATYQGEAYGIGNSLNDALIEAEENYEEEEGELNPFSVDAIGEESPKRIFDIITPIYKNKDVEVYEITPLYVVVHNGKVKGYAFGYFDDAVRNAIANDADLLYKFYEFNEW